jgi:aminotransferase
VALEHNLLIVVDEVYHKLLYDGSRHFSICQAEEAKDRSILLNSFSKTYAMTGWRLGYLAAQKEIIEQCLKVHQYCQACATSIAQYAAVEAYTGSQACVHEMKKEYQARRDLIYGGLQEMGFNFPRPEGAFYAFPSIRSTGMTSEEFAEGLLKGEKVVVIPGSTFGQCGEGYVRCCYATSLAEIEEALSRMKRFVDKI